ncbi:phosphohistidine phosphatase SixA [Synechocystis sp. PCC 7509]|uniref:phosphohistidine phosphatase SixA n=1 Tax=Synechocystis sp. PCC 7509 TaxID=927677 RepID=UPI0002AC22A1|nr:phosphohistidine phosphatase SixA [Synechocystis sp. PCC 7509]
MELYLIRHGIAQERNLTINDDDRTLTKVGQDKTKEVAKRLYNLGLHFDVILTSPLVRSLQTAEIFSFLQPKGELQVSTDLAPNGNIHAWLNWLEVQQYPSATKLALVGHQPNLGEWASMLVWGEAREALILKKAGIIGLNLPTMRSPIGNSQMFLLTPPKFLVG